jgi:hypothetical protein
LQTHIKTVIGNKCSKEISQVLLLFIIFVYCVSPNSRLCFLSVIIVVILLNKEYLGEDFCFGTGVWCGIKSDLAPHEIEKWMYIADVGWQIACYLTACFLYIHLKFYLVSISSSCWCVLAYRYKTNLYDIFQSYKIYKNRACFINSSSESIC